MSTDNSEVPLLTADEASYSAINNLSSSARAGLRQIAMGRAIVVRADELKRIAKELREWDGPIHEEDLLQWADELERAMGGGT